jgi:hypothetical protein
MAKHLPAAPLSTGMRRRCPTTYVNDTHLTAEISAAKLAFNAELLTVPITVRNTNGPTSFAKAFAITAANVTNVQSVIAGAGAT